MSEPFIGEIRAFGFNFPPTGWAECNGQRLPISQFTALFSLLGTTYGGDAINDFALPDLRGRSPKHQGQGPGLPNVTIGTRAGNLTTTLGLNNLPPIPVDIPCSNEEAEEGEPGGNVPAFPTEDVLGYTAPDNANGTLAPLTVGGSAVAFSNESPYLAINYCIALFGIFPSQS